MIHDVKSATSPLVYVAFKVLEFGRGSRYSEMLTQQECCVVVLTGVVQVGDGDQTFSHLGTRQTVFDQKPTDSVYIANRRRVDIESLTRARVALCYAPSDVPRPTKWIKASDNTVERRGQDQNQRVVHNILADSDSTASSLLVVEVFTSEGNWSSYPPHKHDQDNLPHESQLEETYYHEISPPQGFVVQRVYTEDLSLNETMAVQDRDMVLVPKGYHPVGVPYGYHSYYLNVMAGPHRIWRFYNDPNHAWILERLAKQGE